MFRLIPEIFNLALLHLVKFHHPLKQPTFPGRQNDQIYDTNTDNDTIQVHMYLRLI